MLYVQIFIMLRKDDENLIIMHYKKGALGFLVLAIFLKRFFGFCARKPWVFGFGVHCGLRIFRILAFGCAFREKY